MKEREEEERESKGRERERGIERGVERGYREDIFFSTTHNNFFILVLEFLCFWISFMI